MSDPSDGPAHDVDPHVPVFTILGENYEIYYQQDEVFSAPTALL